MPIRKNKIVGGVLVLIMMLVYVNKEMPPPAGLATPAFSRRTSRYCNTGGLVRDGKEGGVKGHTLIGITVTVRHGDRSAIHSIPGSGMEAVYNCTGIDEGSNAWPASLKIISETTGDVINRPTFSAATPTHACHPGQLTRQGFEQLRNLGSYLKKSYAKHPSVFNHSAMYIRSTDYSRTVLSSAGFLSPFLDNGVPLAVRVNENEENEMMHGVGLRASSAGANSYDKKAGGEKVILGGCAKAVSLSRSQKATFRKSSHLKQDLASLFNTGAAEKEITDLGDAIHAGACHGMPLPCGQGGCLTAATAADILKAADKFYCERFMGNAGGRAAAKLSMYPFLRSISDGLQFVADGQTNINTRLYFGHDTVIAPLLAALGVYDCLWPPYASRVVFELWRDDANGSNYVRLIYNGLPLPLRGCGKELCPLPRFRRIINGLILPSTTLDAACEG